jgi:hypothetical protein
MKNLLKMVLASLFLTTFLSMSFVSCKREVPGAKEAAAKKKEAEEAAAAAKASEAAKAEKDKKEGGKDDPKKTEPDPTKKDEEKPVDEGADEDHDNVPDDTDKCKGVKSTPAIDLDKNGCDSDEEKEAYAKKQTETGQFTAALNQGGENVVIKFLKGETEISKDEFKKSTVAYGMTLDPMPETNAEFLIKLDDLMNVKFIPECQKMETQEIGLIYGFVEPDKINVNLKVSDGEGCQKDLSVPDEFTLEKLLKSIEIIAPDEDAPPAVDGDPVAE